MVDARLTPLAAMGLDRGVLMHDGLRLHSGVVYPGIRALPADKSRDTSALPLGYGRDGLPELVYKPDSTLDSRKPTNGYLGLYKGTPPSLHKPVLVPGAESMGLECRVGPGEKPAELGLAGAGGSYLRLPWLSPYPEASMYPFIESSKFAALNMYKASLLSQPNPYLPQHLAYPSLCGAQGGNVTSATAPSSTERLYYMPPYPPSPISSQMGAPPMRIPAVSVAPTSLAHCQDKGLGVTPPYPPQLHQLSPLPQHHQGAPDRDRSPNRSSRPSRPPSRKSSNNNTSNNTSGNENSLATSDCSPHALSRMSQPPGITDSSLDLQRPVARIGQLTVSTADSVSTSSAQTISHPFSVTSIASDQSSPARPSPHKPRQRDAVPEPRGLPTERRSSRSPSKPTVERPAHSALLTKDATEKPLDLSGRMLEFGLPANGFPVKTEALASSAHYSLTQSREILKDNISQSSSSNAHPVVSSTSSKVSERPEMISTLHSSWVVPSPSQHTSAMPTSPRPYTDLGSSHVKSSSPIIKTKSSERPAPQERSSSCPKMAETNRTVSSSQNTNSTHGNSRPLSPKPSSEWIKQNPNHYDLAGHHREGSDKSTQAIKRGDTSTEVVSYKRPCLENGHPSGHLYLSQNDPYLNPSLTYTNRYLHYPIPDSMALHSLSLAGKGPVYPHPVLLGGNSLYPTHLAPKHPLPYHNIAAGPGGEYLAYNSQEMAHPLMQSRSEKLPETKSRVQEKSRTAAESSHHQRKSEKETKETVQKIVREMGQEEQQCSQSKTLSVASTENIVCIDLVHSDTDVDNESSTAVHQQSFTDSVTENNQRECCESNKDFLKTDSDHKPTSQSDSETIRQSTSPKPSHSEKLSEKSFEQTSPKDVCLKSPSASEQDVHTEDNMEESCPSPEPDDQDQSTLRCARTSGEWSSKKEKGYQGRALAAPFNTELRKETDHDKPAAEKVSEKEDSIVDLGESHEEGEDEEDEGNHTSSKNCRRSSLAKRIANSSGYVGDRFKCVTTELYADSSKLSREQRALQRAMMRFSELELKEKEGGGVCVSATAAAAGRELADSQRRERALEPSQGSTKQAERDGCRPPFGCKVSVFHKQSGQRESLSVGEVNHDSVSSNPSGVKDVNKRPTKDSDGHCMPPTLTSAKAHHEDRFGPARKRPKSDPEERDDEVERRCHTDKKPKISSEGHATTDEDDDDDEVRKLKVCIELKGLRLSKPTTGTPSPDRPLVKQERVWHQNRIMSSAQGGHKYRPSDVEDRLAAQRAEINRKWGCEKLLNGVAPPLSPGPLKERVQLTNPLSSDRSHKDYRRGPSSPNQDLSLGGPNLFKARRHSDADKPKGKRPCKTKHTSQKERERRKEFTPGSPGQRPISDLGAPEDEKTIEQCGVPRKRAVSPNHYPCSPVKPCSPASHCPPSLQPQANGRVLPTEGAVMHRTPPAEPPALRPIPPEARRLIVNKNAGETLLQRAARLGYEEVVLYCLENKVCEVNHRDYAGYCALHEACARGWLNIVQHLLDYGADINCSAQDGTRPIHDAVENDHLDVVRVLLSYGADPTLATYSGRGLLKMTHSDSMERFLTDYFADLQGRSDDDPGLYWEFFGSAVCESTDECGVYDILADPPGPDDGDEEDKREVFEFEFSDRPLLPCYNIQVSLSQGPRNWLLLSDVLRRLRMSARGFRQTFPHMEVVTVAEAEFYRQASLSQLFSCPEELEGFHSDSKELLDLVEDSAELAALLGSSLECLDDRWDHPTDKLKNNIKAIRKLVC